MKIILNFLIAATGLLPLAASAQWQWIDKDGRNVFSDRSPPPEISEKNILKRPGNRAATAEPIDTASEPKAVASLPKMTGIDRTLTDKKKKAEEAEQGKLKAEEERIAKTKIENCARAKQAKSSFDSGVRIARINEKGEREIMDDSARAIEVKRIQSILDTDCK